MENPCCALSRLHLQNKIDIEKTNDRISQLPDAILHYILSMMPMKFIIRTSILSRRWRNLWKPIWAYSTSLDFDAQFRARQTPEEFVAAVNRYLQLHKAKEIHFLRLLLLSPDSSDAEKWVEFALAKGVKELHMVFGGTIYFIQYKPMPYKLLNSIFIYGSVTHLNLSRCTFIPPLNLKVCTSLKTLHLSHFRMEDALFENMLLNIPLLEELSIRDCVGLTHLKVSASNLPLESLTVVDCWTAIEIEIFAPNLQSFHFNGKFIHMYFKNISSLVDVFVNDIYGRDFDDFYWMSVLHHLEHVKILTLCNALLKDVRLAEECRYDYLPITFQNLQELQLLMDWFGDSYVANTYSFFKNCPCPCLEKLFIQFTYNLYDPSGRLYCCEGMPSEDTPDIVLGNLKVIKMNYFRGLKDEMQLVKFFLEKSIVLESLVLVAPEKPVGKHSASESKFIDSPLGILREQLLILANESSSNAQILLCEYSDNDGALAPTHTEIYA